MILSIFLFTFLPFLYHFWRNVFKSFAHFLIELLFFLLLCCESSLYILNTNLLLDMWFVNIFSHSVVFFHFLDSVFWCTEDFKFFSFISYIFLVSYLSIHYQSQNNETFPMFSSKSFIVLVLAFRLLIHFELISVYDVR